MLPSQSWESAEVGVSGHHSAAMLDRDGRVLSVGDQLPYGSRLAAQPLEYVQVVRSGTHYARRGAFQERGQECERQVESGWRVEDSGVGYDADETGQNEDGESERFRSRRQASDPGCIRGVVRGGILDVRVYQDIHVGKQHLESTAPASVPGFFVLDIERPRPVEIDARAGVNATHGNQMEGRRLRRFAALQSIVQRPGNEGAYADAADFGGVAHLPRKLVVE